MARIVAGTHYISEERSGPSAASSARIDRALASASRSSGPTRGRWLHEALRPPRGPALSGPIHDPLGPEPSCREPRFRSGGFNARTR
jgi:hypothetical protein